VNRTPLNQMSAKREQALRDAGTYQPGSTFARPAPSPSQIGSSPGVRPEARARETRNPAPKPSRETGFTAAQRLLIRTRAGSGDPEQALCEACGIWLGRAGGQVHHRQNRQMGGSRRRNRVSNGALLCGTPEVGDHGEATRLAPRMKEMGFVLESWQKPEQEPFMLHGEQGGLLVWADDSGNYVDEDGNVLAAPERAA